MHEASIIFTLTTVHLIGLMSPGPDFALVVHNVTRYGRRTGLAIALGLSCGIFCHSLLSLTGISYLVRQAPLLFTLLQICGGSYLLYLGIQALNTTFRHWHQSPVMAAETPEAVLPHGRQAFTRGFMTNILNPKALVFFVSLMSSLIPVGMSAEGKGIAVMLLWSLSLAWFSMLAWLFSTQRLQRKMQLAGRYIDVLCGLIFSVIGGGILWHSLYEWTGW